MSSGQRYAHVIYSDDVRQEIGGKVSYVGVYGGAMYCHSLPLTIPKLCASVFIITPIEQPFSQLAVRMFLQDDEGTEIVLAEVQFPAEVLEMPVEPAESFEARGSTKRMVMLGLQFPNITIERQQYFRVHVTTDSEELRGPALTITTAPVGNSQIGE